jgi:hypothetical protein
LALPPGFRLLEERRYGAAKLMFLAIEASAASAQPITSLT